MNEAIAKLSAEYAITKSVENAINVSLEELVTNIISYGYDDDEEHFIDLDMSVVRNVLTVTIADSAKPYDPFSRPTVNVNRQLNEIIKPGGLGVHLVRNLMDDVHYERIDNRNVVTISKAIADD